MKTILVVLGALIVLSRLNQNQGAAVTVSVGSPAAANPPYGGSAANLGGADAAYSNLAQNSGEGGVGPGTPLGSSSGGSGSGSSASGYHYARTLGPQFIPGRFTVRPV